MYADSAVFFSDKKDASCVTKADPLTLGFTLFCTDNTKFATDGDKTFKLRYRARYQTRDGEPATPAYVDDEFTITLHSECKAHTVTLGTPTAAITTYSGGTLNVDAISVTHLAASAATCDSHTSKLVEVSINDSTYVSSGTVYTDLISTANTELAFTLSPKASTFDTVTAPATDTTRYVRVTVTSLYAT